VTPGVGFLERARTGLLGKLPTTGFIRQVGETYATQVFVVALGFVNSILVTRLLGPEGRGLLAAANTFSAVGVQLGNLGLHSWNTYHVSREPRSLPVLIGNSLAVCAVGGLGALVALGLFQVRPSLAPVGGALLLLALAGIPLGLTNLLLQNLLIGTQRIHEYNTVDLATRVLAVALVAATAPLGLVSPELVYALVLLSVGLSAGWCLAKLHRGLPGRVAWSAASLRNALGYGVRAYLGSLFAFLVLRSDILLVKYLRGATETGYYVIAVGLADILMMLPNVVGMVLFPRFAAAPDVASRWVLARRVLAWMVPATPVALGATLLVARPLIRLAYGPAFAPSFPAVVWLLPGIGCLALNTVFMNLFASCGMPLVVTVSPLAALVVNVGLNLALVPRVGFVGAAASSTVAYALMLVVSLVYVQTHLLRPKGD
jgi:O-antigen/teichoic acid export membrane protein